MSLLSSAVASPPHHRGLNRTSAARIEPIDGRLFSGGAAVAADTAYLVWFRVDRPITVAAMEYLCSTAAGNVDLGVYSTADFATLTRLGSTGATAAAGANAIQSINLTAPVLLVPGTDYFAGLVGSSASLVVARNGQFGNLSAATKTALMKTASNPLPASITTPAGANYIPWLCLKAA
jgi:hypothetical protein